jgi:hypothetical protein
MAAQSVKDILDAEIPKPTWVFQPTHAAPLKSEMSVSRGSKGWALDSRSGKYEEYGSDTPRIQGGRQGLLIDPQRENEILYSSDISNGVWDTSGVSLTNGANLIAGGNSKYINPSGGTSDRITIQGGDAGGYSTNIETLSVIWERQTNQTVWLRLLNDTAGGIVAEIKYDMGSRQISSQSLSGTGGPIEAYIRVITESGPNGDPVYQAVVTYDSGGESLGDTRDLWIIPDNSSGVSNICLHHVQLEEAKFPSTPIRTTGSQKTRQADDDLYVYSGGQPEWFNSRKGTFLLTVKSHGAIGNAQWLAGGGVRWFYQGTGVQTYDGSNFLSLGDIQTDMGGQTRQYKTRKLAVSCNRKKMRGASDGGNFGSSAHNGNLLDQNALEMGPNNRTTSVILSLKFIPEFLSQRQLEILTA